MAHPSIAKINQAWGRYHRAHRAVGKVIRPYLAERARAHMDMLGANHRKIDSTLREMGELARAIKPLWFSVKAAGIVAKASRLVADQSPAEVWDFASKDTHSASIFIELVDLYAINCRFVLRLMRATQRRHSA